MTVEDAVREFLIALMEERDILDTLKAGYPASIRRMSSGDLVGLANTLSDLIDKVTKESAHADQ